MIPIVIANMMLLQMPTLKLNWSLESVWGFLDSTIKILQNNYMTTLIN